MKLKLFLTAWIVFSLHFSTNVVREHYPAFALIEAGTFRVDEYLGYHPDIFKHADGHAYIGNNVASSVIAAVPLFVFEPGLSALEQYERSRLQQKNLVFESDYRTDYPLQYVFFQKVKARGLTLRFGASTVVTSAFLLAPLSALFVVLMYVILMDRGVSSRSACWLAITFAFGTPLFFRTSHLNNNIFVMYAAFASFWLLWSRKGDLQPISGPRKFWAGVLAGLCLACDYSGMIPLVCLYGYLVLNRPAGVSFSQSLRSSTPFIIGTLPPIGFLWYSQWLMYGHPFFPGQFWMPDVNYTDRGWRGFSFPTFEVFLLNLFHPSYGMYLFCPLLVLGLIPAWKYRSESLILPRRERVFVTALVAFFLLFCAANQYSLMQWNCGFRYLLPLVPFIFLALCDWLKRLPKWALLALTIPMMVHTWVLCMARDCNPNNDTWREAPSFQYWLENLAVETVPASYLRVWHEGIQLPWLRVLRLTASPDHPILSQTWLPYAVFGICGITVYFIWRFGKTSTPTQGRPLNLGLPAGDGFTIGACGRRSEESVGECR